MHDLGFFREHLDAMEQMARNRGVSLDLAAFREIDAERRSIITSTERLKAERNKANDEIARAKKAGQDASGILARMKQVSEEVKQADERITQLDEKLREFLLMVPNIPHSSCLLYTSRCV